MSESSLGSDAWNSDLSEPIESPGLRRDACSIWRQMAAGGHTNTRVGRRIRQLRLAKGLTQKELAAPHYTAAHVSTIEAGRRSPSRAALVHFARKLGVEPD